MIFRTELDGPVTRNTARQGVDAAYRIPDNVEPLRAAVEALNLPERPLSCAYKAPRRPPFDWSIFFLASSSCALLRLSFAICSIPRVDKRPDFDGFHMLSTDRPQLSPRIHR
jgi:hypothetical protein